MRLLTPVLLICLAAAAAGFSIRRIIYLNNTTEHDDRLPYVGGSIIQVKPSDGTIEKIKNMPNTNRFPRFSKYQQYVETKTPPVTHSSQLVNRRITRELGSRRKLMRQLEEEILRESMLDTQRNTRTLIQAPLLQGITCPPGQKPDRGGKKCRPPW